MASRQSLIGLGLVLAALLLGGCAVGGASSAPRVSDLAAAGDDRFRASQRLVLEGLDDDERGRPDAARARYERALQADSSNPWAYLALARHYVDSGQPRAALRHAERAAALFESIESESPGALVHCDGLRGAALALEGRDDEARPLLEAAARRDPSVWGDGHLDAAELR